MQDLLEGAAAVCLTSGCGVETLAWCLLDCLAAGSEGTAQLAAQAA